MKNKNYVMKIIKSHMTPLKYINNFSTINNSAINIDPENLNKKELNPSPTLKYNNDINQGNYKIQTYQKKAKDSNINNVASNTNKYLHQRKDATLNDNNKYPSNYSYYESKYSKNNSNQQKVNSDVNKIYKINSEIHKIKYQSNKKIKINDQINNSLMENVNKSYALSPQSFSKNDTNGNIITSPPNIDFGMFYLKLPENKVNYFQKTDLNTQKKYRNVIIYKGAYNNNINQKEKIIQPKTPSLYSNYKINNSNTNYLLTNYSTKKKLNTLNSKSLESPSFVNRIIDFHNMNKSNNNMNNRSLNFKENNFKKVIKYTKQNENIISNFKEKEDIVQPFRLSGDNKNIKNNNNNLSNTIVNITYINENKNYIKNVYSNDVLKPQSQDKFILDNETTEKHDKNKYNYLTNDKTRTPNHGIKIVKINKMKVYSPPNEKINRVNYKTNDSGIKDLNKNENNYMNEVKNIMYHKIINSEQNVENNNKYKSETSKTLSFKDKMLSKDMRSLTNNLNKSKKKKLDKNYSNENYISLNIDKIKDKISDTDYQLIYNAKIIDGKYRKKSHNSNTFFSNKENNKFNTNNTKTFDTNKSYYSKTASKINGSKSLMDSLIKENKVSNKKLNDSSNLSKLTITNTSSKNQKSKIINNKKEKEKKINDKINPFIYKETEKDIKKKNSEMVKSSIKKEKEKEKKIYIKKIEGLSIAGRNEKGITKINQDTFFIEKNVNGVDNFNIFGVLDGHGEFGHLASKFVKNYIINQIKSHPLLKNEKDPKKIYSKITSNGYKILAKIYLDADIMIKHQGFDCSRSGTTCIIIIQLLNNIICANTGDSRAIIVFDKDDNLFKSQIFPLSYDCKPELPNEKKRIEESGGVVEKAYYSDDEDGEYSGPYRVWAKGEDFPGLAMSRSIGDMDAKKVGVIPNPQIVEYVIDKTSKYFVMASDGIWEFINNERCMKIANEYFLKNDCLGLCRELSKKATELWDINDIIRDDITVVVGFF